MGHNILMVEPINPYPMRQIATGKWGVVSDLPYRGTPTCKQTFFSAKVAPTHIIEAHPPSQSPLLSLDQFYRVGSL
jgi:hypothetical protein